MKKKPKNIPKLPPKSVYLGLGGEFKTPPGWLMRDTRLVLYGYDPRSVDKVWVCNGLGGENPLWHYAAPIGGELDLLNNQGPTPADKAVAACRALVAAYRAGARNGGSVDWSDVDVAYVLAKAALRKPSKKKAK